MKRSVYARSLYIYKNGDLYVQCQDKSLIKQLSSFGNVSIDCLNCVVSGLFVDETPCGVILKNWSIENKIPDSASEYEKEYNRLYWQKRKNEREFLDAHLKFLLDNDKFIDEDIYEEMCYIARNMK